MNKIWVLDPERATATPLNPDMPADVYPAWSADSQSLVFAGSTGQGWGFFRKGIDASAAAEHLYDFPITTTYPTDVSRDGLIVFMQTGNDFDVLTLNVPERRVTPLQATPAAERHGRLSPDGRWLAFESTESGSQQVWVRTVTGDGVKRMVSNAGGGRPRWRADGRELFYVINKSVMAVSVQLTPSLELGVPGVLFENLALGGFPAPTPQGSNYDVAPEGGRFLLNLRDSTYRQSPITVVLNWPALVRH